MIKRGLIFILSLIVIFALAACQEEETDPVKIGFVGSLSGRVSDLSVSGRDGVVLAVEQFNARGGLGGRPVQLLTRDDGHDRDQARDVVKDLIEEEVVGIIGHMTSSMSRATVHLINQERVLMISPTTSTSFLEGRHDFFLRVFPGHRAETRALAEYIYNDKGIERVGVLYDLSNHEYTIDWYSHFRQEFNARGGEISSSVPFSSGKDFSYNAVVERVLFHEPEGILLISGGVDAGRFVQQFRNANFQKPLFGAAWAKTYELIHHGGRAVEDFSLVHYFDPGAQNEEYLAFCEEYRDRFGRDPEFGAFFGYEAARVLLWALENTSDWSAESLRQLIINRGNFPGLQGEFFIDRFGDSFIEEKIFQVKDGAFQRVDNQ